MEYIWLTIIWIILLVTFVLSLPFVLVIYIVEWVKKLREDWKNSRWEDEEV